MARIAIKPDGARPRTPPTSRSEQTAKADPGAAKDTADGKDHAPAGHKTINIIDGSKGTQESVIIATATARPPRARRRSPAAIEPKLLEQSRYGMIPVAAAGMKPFTAYAWRPRPTAPGPRRCR